MGLRLYPRAPGAPMKFLFGFVMIFGEGIIIYYPLLPKKELHRRVWVERPLGFRVQGVGSRASAWGCRAWVSA